MYKNSIKICISILIVCLIVSIFPIEVIKSDTNLKIDQIDFLLDQSEYDANSILVKYIDSDNLVSIEISDEDPQVASTQIQKDRVRQRLLKYIVDDSVEFVQPNYIYKMDAWDVINGEMVPEQYNSNLHWYYDQSDLPAAWEKLECPFSKNCGGSKEVIVAVVDSGLAFENYNDKGGYTDAIFTASPVYKNINLYTNTAEIPNNFKDDDCNGVIDDYHGADAYTLVSLNITKTNTCSNNTPILMSKMQSKSGHPVDTYGHGTYVTGLIASDIFASGNATISPAFNVSILPISANKHFEEFFTTLTVVKSIEYATQQSADIITLSLTTSYKDRLLDEAIQEAYEAGILVVAAAGNAGNTNPAYPASYDNVLSVGSLNSDNTKSSYSSYGPNLDLMAYVGDGSTFNKSSVFQQSLNCFGNCNKNNIGDGFKNFNLIGTSFAAPQVTALAALLKSQRPEITPDEIIDRLIETAQDVGPIGFDNTTGYGVINFYDALYTQQDNAPASTDLKPVYRFFSPVFGTHFYTTSQIEKDDLIKDKASFWNYEGVAYKVYADTNKGKALYRFWSSRYTSHFYTANETEKSGIATQFSSDVWSFEGVAFTIPEQSSSVTVPVYRFWSPSNSRHFFTTNEAEKNNLISNLSNTWNFEGVAFYAFPVNN